MTMYLEYMGYVMAQIGREDWDMNMVGMAMDN